MSSRFFVSFIFLDFDIIYFVAGNPPPLALAVLLCLIDVPHSLLTDFNFILGNASH